MVRTSLLVALSVIAFGLTGPSCQKGVVGGNAPQIKVSPDSPEISFGRISLGESAREAIYLENIGKAPLDVRNIWIEGGNGAFDLVELPTLPTTMQVGDFAKFAVTYTATAGASLALLHIKSNDPTRPTVTIQLNPGTLEAILETDPGEVNLGRVNEGTTKNQLVVVKNVGSAELVITDMIKNGDPEFQLDTSSMPSLPIRLKTSETTSFTVTFSPTSANKATGEVVFKSNDPRGDRRLVLIANSTGPCIVASPKEVDFQTRPIGIESTLALTITSCGSDDLKIDSIAISAGGEKFGVKDLPPLPGILKAGTSYTLTVTYLPLDEGADSGTLTILSNGSGRTQLDVPLKGVGSANNCPNAVITATPDETEVPPQTTLKLSGLNSQDPDGTVVEYEWTVEAPLDSVTVFLPSASVPQPTFEMNIAGTYKFRLRVRDNAGNWSCNTAEHVVQVIPTSALHIELTWVTPGDKDETDECPQAYLTGKFCGSDLDLHLLHPKAKDWFDGLYDCYFRNPKPKWGNATYTGDDPRLDRDDIDGGGPENINLDFPETTAYKVGVHYWSHHGYGPATAKVKIFFYGQLKKEFVRTLSHWQFWDVAIVGSDGAITPVDGVKNNVPGDF
ncbi:MAG: choice-of-anchor D domain-containing protein [Myxococcales bacterium]|nr:choice-of-anchor D domain-containing protein [Myxococcales bacterium]